jgi:hypothetical protein
VCSKGSYRVELTILAVQNSNQSFSVSIIPSVSIQIPEKQLAQNKTPNPTNPIS